MAHQINFISVDQKLMFPIHLKIQIYVKKDENKNVS
jgi:hypothetical protein